jgi:cysteine synthase
MSSAETKTRAKQHGAVATLGCLACRLCHWQFRSVRGPKAFEAGGTDRCLIFDNITQTVGQTPIVKLNRLAPEGVNVYVKCEYFNPLSSVKDRLAVAIIEGAEKRGELKPGGTVVEATSGNTGIALAMVCAQRGYNFVAVMAASFSVERRKIMRMLGAKVLVTPAPLGGTGMVKKAEELAEKNGWFLARQFETEDNADFHRRTTGPEIFAAFEKSNLKLDYFVLGYGTGGTMAGAGQYLKEVSPSTKLIVTEPKGAPLITSGVPQERKEVLGKFGAPASAHPQWKPHPIQGWTPNFIPKVCEDGIKALGVKKDEVVLVDGKDGMDIAMKLARLEGIFTGISGGSNVWSALEVAKKAPKGSNILTILADTAERYMTTPLFEAIEAEMNDEEKELFNTTPLGQS